VIIPDLNVLLYAVDRASVHHGVAKAWLEETLNQGADELGLPWVVHLGFLRLTTSKKVFPQPLTIEEACAWLDHLRSHPALIPLDPGKAHGGILRHLLLSAGTGGNLVTDAHLAALTMEHDAVLVTGDRDFLRFPGLKTKILF
jgi:toxin-antitoxin system PIN domain toxin